MRTGIPLAQRDRGLLEQLSADVLHYLVEGLPVVALESTLITHGLPRPLNVETALAAEGIVRAAGALPATIALMDGYAKIGLDRAQLERLAKLDGIAKASQRDLAIMMALEQTAGTTVAATAFLADRAGIRFFATGGIGGVHRGAASSFDVSADLYTLASTPIAIICAGAKSILDLPATLELLESLSVPVIGYRTSTFPAFYVASSGLGIEHRDDNVVTLAMLVRQHWRLGGAGVLIVQEPPAELALDAAELERAVGIAEEEARRQRIRGKAVTPFLLARLAELTQGRSLKVNQALIVANARLAAEIAIAFQDQERGPGT